MTLVVTVAAPPLLSLLTKHEVPLWVAVLAFGVALLMGILFATAAGGGTTEYENLQSKLYAEHVRDALALLRRLLEGKLPRLSIRDLIEIGIFEPAHELLMRDPANAARGDVRFSILRVDGDDFVMSDEHGLLPARGHRPESRQEFCLPIKDSFAGVAYNTGRVQSSNDLAHDERFKRHPKAESGREYQSMVSVPLWGSNVVDGVLNVLATSKDAFSPVDRTYITLLASVIDVAEHISLPSGQQY
ncbi:MAG TPA: GAF domain-containing protein [Solirubrobacteraceae bacterium]|nr:GAF domain-containing protein [Solirubrobacteraceae bacterium]